MKQVSSGNSLPRAPRLETGLRRYSKASNNVPRLFSSVTEFATGHTGTQAIVADTDRVVLVLVRKVVLSLGHGTHEHADALSRSQGLNVVPDSDHGCVET